MHDTIEHRALWDILQERLMIMSRCRECGGTEKVKGLGMIDKPCACVGASIAKEEVEEGANLKKRGRKKIERKRWSEE